MVSLFKRVRQWFQRPSAGALETQFETSARELISACKDSCQTSDEFLNFLSAFYTELAGMQKILTGIQVLPINTPNWSLDDFLTTQLPAVQAAIASVSGQIKAREHILVRNIDAIAYLNRALEKVRGQAKPELLAALHGEIEQMLEQTNRQIILLRMLASQIDQEKIVFDGYVALPSQTPTTLN